MEKIKSKITFGSAIFIGLAVFLIVFEWYSFTSLLNIFDDLDSELVRDGSRIMFNLIGILFGFSSVSCFYFLSKFYELIEKPTVVMYDIKDLLNSMNNKIVSLENKTDEERKKLNDDHSASLESVNHMITRTKDFGKNFLIYSFLGFVAVFYVFIRSIFESMIAFLQANNRALFKSFNELIVATSLLICINLLYVSFIGNLKDMNYIAFDLYSDLKAAERAM